MVLLGFLLLWVVVLFPPPLAWCCLPSPPLGGRVPHLPCWVVLLSFPSFQLWCFLPSRPLGRAARFSSIGQCCFFFSSPFGGIAFLPLLWVGLLFPRLLLGGAAWFPPPLGGVAFLLSFGVELLSFRSFEWAAFHLSSDGWCCLVSFSFAWCCPSSPPFGKWCLSPLSCWVVLLGLLLLWVVLRFPSPLAWCCLSSPPQGGTTFPPSSVGWCCLVHSGGVAFFFFCVVLNVFPSIWRRCVPSRLLGRAAGFSSFGWCCCFFSSPFRGAAFLFLLCVELHFSPPSDGWCCCPKSKRKDAK